MEYKQFLEPMEIVSYATKKGISKANASLLYILTLGFLGGAFIAVGYLAYIRIAGSMHGELAGLGSLLGAAVFPVGLISILIGGGELITSNMMAVTLAWLQKEISFTKLFKNITLVTLFNFIGALFVAYVLGHLTGLTEGSVAEKTIHVAESKVSLSPLANVCSAIGCNWLVCMGTWLSFSAKDVAGKIVAIWFPIMTFVAIGFQHVAANMFVIPAAIFAGASISWGECLYSLCFTFLGNYIGGAILVGLFYKIAFKSKT